MAEKREWTVREAGRMGGNKRKEATGPTSLEEVAKKGRAKVSRIHALGKVVAEVCGDDVDPQEVREALEMFDWGP